MSRSFSGIIPVMITPFTADGQIDEPGLKSLVDWYVDHGADVLFGVCQSSEMQFLSLEERVALGKATVKASAGRLPVIVSGHVSDTPDAQADELQAMVETGADGIVLVTNRFAVGNDDSAAWIRDLDTLLARLPEDLPLGLYECPAPYRRLLSDEELQYCARTGRFGVLKDVSCDLPTVERRVKLVEGTPLQIVNANAAIAAGAMRAGARGFSGVFTNFHPDLYKWLLEHGADHPELAADLTVFLALAAQTEPMGYPKLAKLYHQRLGTFAETLSRTVPFDIEEKFWALTATLEHIEHGTETFRARIAATRAS
ncbi:dihydrodipicolinate synthase family protein [Salipiger pallidus]|uniref:Dihydrodipicolinate synthase family protein n=1 Tax=Salipiger pallidus TaxID=1775170 RepID=A0A8J2ZMS6_9RHOB|nr:dihydrodipicolinate synthase family protein [Salipiger pallidus]GGG83644.1 dihydrodipicolinate synthase family protein [Salipiger pallidus]